MQIVQRKGLKICKYLNLKRRGKIQIVSPEITAETRTIEVFWTCFLNFWLRRIFNNVEYLSLAESLALTFGQLTIQLLLLSFALTRECKNSFSYLLPVEQLEFTTIQNFSFWLDSFLLKFPQSQIYILKRCSP